jgi:hypothetical protein
MKNILLLLITIISTQSINAQINFSSQINGSSVTFILTQQGQFYESVIWDFGDSSISIGTNEMEDTVTHVYLSIGNYKACVSGYPMPPALMDSACKFVEIITTGINQIEKISLIEIYPNPANNNLNIKISEKSNIEILNIEGQIIKSICAIDKATTIDLSDLASGMYFVKAKMENGIEVKKFVKE